MTATERAKRSDALYYETVSVNRRVLCDMVANREADLEDARAENAKLRDGANAMRQLYEDELKHALAENAKLREELSKWERLTAGTKLRELLADTLMQPRDYCQKHDIEYDSWDSANDHLDARMRELGIEVDE